MGGGVQNCENDQVSEDEVSKKSSFVKIGQVVLKIERGNMSGEEGTEERILEHKYADFRVPELFSKRDFEMRSSTMYFLIHFF